MTPPNELRSNPLFAFARNLPYRKWWFWVLLLIGANIASTTYEKSRPVTYDATALGFSDAAAMQAAFAKGYHTRQKMEEMEKFHGRKSATP